MKSSRVGHVLDPQVSGALGDATVFESRDGLPRVSKVEYVLDALGADDLILSFRVFLVSLELGQVLSRAAPTGFRLADVTVRPSLEYLAVFGEVPHPGYRWLQVVGVDGADDCWLAADGRLGMSDRMLARLKSARLTACVIDPRGTILERGGGQGLAGRYLNRGGME